MAGLTPGSAFADLGLRLRWQGRRVRAALRRSVGLDLVLACALAVVALAAAWQARSTGEEARRLLALSASQPEPAPPITVPADTARARLGQFESALLPVDHVPAVIQDLVRLADAQDLQFERGDYRAVPDVNGLMVRYAMSLPVTGEPQAVYAFIAAALQAQPMLALESLQIQREALGATQVEARVQWVLFASVSPDRGVLLPVVGASR